MTVRAAFAAVAIARVPFVVVSTIVLPRTRAGVNSTGELERSKPGTGRHLRSPASSFLSRSAGRTRREAVSTSAIGMILSAPLSIAATIVLDALSTSMTTTEAFCKAFFSACSSVA